MMKQFKIFSYLIKNKHLNSKNQEISNKERFLSQ